MYNIWSMLAWRSRHQSVVPSLEFAAIFHQGTLRSTPRRTCTLSKPKQRFSEVWQIRSLTERARSVRTNVDVWKT